VSWSAVVGARFSFHSRWIICISVVRFVGIKWQDIRFFTGTRLRTLIHMALDHMNIIHLVAFGTFNLSFPIPEAIRIEIINRIAFFAPNNITHGTPP
jgi:hypothetical protein